MAWGRRTPKFEMCEDDILPYILPRQRMSVAEFIAQRREENADDEALKAYVKSIVDKDKEKSKVKEATAQEKRELALIMFLLSPIPGFAILHMLAFMYHHLPKF